MLIWIAVAALGLAAAIDDGNGGSLLRDPAAAAAHDYCAAPPLDAAVLASAEAALNPDNVSATEPDQAAGLLIVAGTAIAAEQDSPRACQRIFESGRRQFERALDRNVRMVSRSNRPEFSDDPAIADIQRRIRDLWVRDQAGRLTYVSLRTNDRSGDDFWAQRLATANAVATDHESTALMREVLEHYDWIDRERFGARISSHAWILVQHADDHPDFQQLALDRMQPYLETGGVSTRDFAYLTDRVAVNTGREQTYGTQPADQCNDDGSLDLKPVSDRENLDARRAAMGLGPARSDLEQMARERCG